MTTLTTSPPQPELSEGNRAPDWSLVPFDVGCPRCEQDIHGLSESTCPACALEIDWAAAVPIENLTCMCCGYHLLGLREPRCPECGGAFTWEEALRHFHRSELPLFEYRWRVAPMKSAWSNWRTSWSPRRLWSLVGINDPPMSGPIVVLLITVFAVGLIVCPLLQRAVSEMFDRLSSWSADGGVRWGWYFSVGYYVKPQWHFWVVLAGATSVWLATGIGALMLLRASMARYKIRNGHVVRALAYSALPIAVLPLLLTVAFICLVIVQALTDRYFIREFAGYCAVAAIAAEVWLMHRIRVAYRDYIQMPHAFGVAVLTQIIAVLCAMSAGLILHLSTS